MKTFITMLSIAVCLLGVMSGCEQEVVSSAEATAGTGSVIDGPFDEDRDAEVDAARSISADDLEEMLDELEREVRSDP